MNKTTAYIIAVVLCILYFLVHSIVIAEMGGIRPIWRMLSLLPIIWIWRGIVSIAKKEDKEVDENVAEITENREAQAVEEKDSLSQVAIYSCEPPASSLPAENIEEEKQPSELIIPFCPKCNKQFAIESRFCDIDGTSLETPKPKCAVCGKEYPDGTKFCSEDGAKLTHNEIGKVQKAKKSKGLYVLFTVMIAVFLAILAATFWVFSEQPQEDNAIQHGVIINGVRWATRNIDVFDTFADFQERSGGHFTWERAQDVCPAGWRVPTQQEFQSLINAGSTWTANWNNTGVRGRVFGISPNQIFLPAAGWRNDGVLLVEGIWGYYWCSSYTCFFGFSDERSVTYTYRGQAQFSVRCVAISP